MRFGHASSLGSAKGREEVPGTDPFDFADTKSPVCCVPKLRTRSGKKPKAQSKQDRHQARLAFALFDAVFALDEAQHCSRFLLDSGWLHPLGLHVFCFPHRETSEQLSRCCFSQAAETKLSRKLRVALANPAETHHGPV